MRLLVLTCVAVVLAATPHHKAALADQPQLSLLRSSPHTPSTPPHKQYLASLLGPEAPIPFRSDAMRTFAYAGRFGGFDGNGLPPVTLSASFPRGGSTYFLRQLEYLTGVRNGAVYVDEDTTAVARNLTATVDRTRNFVVLQRQAQLPTRPPSGNDTLVLKTHHPFLSFPDERRVPHPVRLIRLSRAPILHVVGHAARLSKQQEKKRKSPARHRTVQNLRRRSVLEVAVADYLAFWEHWDEVETRIRAEGVPVLHLRVESLCLDPSLWGNVTAFLGLHRCPENAQVSWEAAVASAPPAFRPDCTRLVNGGFFDLFPHHDLKKAALATARLADKLGYRSLTTALFKASPNYDGFDVFKAVPHNQ